MSEDERDELLYDMKVKWGKLNEAYGKLSFTLDVPSHAPKGGARGGDDAAGEGHQDPAGAPGGGGGRAPRVKDPGPCVSSPATSRINGVENSADCIIHRATKHEISFPEEGLGTVASSGRPKGL